MGGSSYGRFFKVMTFGESHGVALGTVVDGMPAGVPIDTVFLQKELDRRRPGSSNVTSPRKEEDKLQILSGVFEGVTLGTPICLVIFNHDTRSQDYEPFKNVYRPGHGDFTYQKKYGIRDWRGGGRASARETVARVAAGALAKTFLNQKKIQICGFISQVGEIQIPFLEKTVPDLLSVTAKNPFFCADLSMVDSLNTYIETLKQEGDSVGAKITLKVSGVPIGLGQPVFDKLEADLAKSLLSIPAVKGFEIGAGFNAVKQKGSEHRDPITSEGFLSNFSGGTLGGISTGQDLHISIALKPTSSVKQRIQTIDNNNKSLNLSVSGRHDPCVGLRAVPIAEAMVACVLMDHWLMCYGESHYR